MMSGKERREEILQRITNSKTPVSGAALAKSCEVSRQVIVQDIALIRAAGYDVIATNRGYICSSPVRETRVFEVNHTDEQMQDELNTIVDFGGVVLDVIVRHEVYGELRAELMLVPGDKEEILARMQELKNKRVEKQPLEYPSAGSAFKRPEGYFAGKLVMDAGLSGYAVGGAKVSEKHCGFLINAGGATASDVMELIRQIQAKVKEQFGVQLEPEIQFLGEF